MDAAPEPTAEFSLASYDGTLDVDRRDLSYAANELLSDATKLCREVNHRMVEPIHVAWVLFSGADCASDAYRELGHTILKRAGINHTKCMKFMEDEMHITCEKAVIDRAPSFSAKYVKWMQEAQYEAQLYRDTRISIDHLAVALAMHLQQYGEHVGFSEMRFRLAAERVRGLEPLDDLLAEEDEPLGTEQLTVDIDAALFKPDDQLPTKLDRISPASSAPDSPPESERRDSDPSIAEDDLPRFTDDFIDSMTPQQQDDYWRAVVLQEDRERDLLASVDSEDGSGSELSDGSLVDGLPPHRFVEYQPDDTGSVLSDGPGDGEAR